MNFLPGSESNLTLAGSVQRFIVNSKSKAAVYDIEIPPAPLVRETLDKTNADFKQKKKKLLPELPMLTVEELLDELKQETLSDDYITASLMAMGYVKSANEMNHLMRVDAGRHKRKQDPPSRPLTKNRPLQKYLARFFSQAENNQKRGDWKDLHLVRMRIAGRLFEKYPWLSQAVLQKSVMFLSFLDSQRTDHEIVKANVYLMLAFVTINTKDNHTQEAMEYLLKSEAISEEICMEDGVHHGHISVNYKDDARFLKVVRIKMERPISIHGWRKSSGIEAFETIVASELSSFYAAAILHSWLYLQILKTKAHHSHRFWKEHDELYMDQDEHNHTEEAFKQGMLLAYQGQNETNILSLLFTYGKYLMRKSNYDEAKAIFTQMHEKARECNDKESAGVAYNRLGKISHRQWAIVEAADHYYSEWELGMQDAKHNVLLIDSLKSLGRIMLEEGHFVNAEMCFREAFDKYEEIKKATKDTVNPEEMHEDEDDLYDEAWGMSGVAAGHSLWNRFACIVTYAKGKAALDPILEWKCTRRPLPKVPEVFHKLKKIDRKPRPRQVSQSLATRMKRAHDSEYLRQMNFKTPEELLTEWIDSLEDDDYEFQNDKDCEESGCHLEDLEFRYYRPGFYKEYIHSSDESDEQEQEEEYDDEEEDEEEVEEEEEQEEEVTEVIIEEFPEQVEEEEDEEEEDEEEDEEEEETDEFEDVLEFIGEYDSNESVFSLMGEGEYYVSGPNPSLERTNFEADEEEEQSELNK